MGQRLSSQSEHNTSTRDESARSSEVSSSTKEAAKEKNVDFCVNVDIGGWGKQLNELMTKIPPQFMCSSNHDILRFARIDVLGVTSPQVYLKVKGNWTGGHQENLNARAANLNIGPASSLWHCVGGLKQIELFRELAK